MGLFEPAHICENYKTRHSYTLPKEDQKKKKCESRVIYPFNSADISIFSTEISKFCYIKKNRYRLNFDR